MTDKEKIERLITVVGALALIIRTEHPQYKDTMALVYTIIDKLQE